jgi:uncharacterized protein (TIGR02145 family)
MTRVYYITAGNKFLFSIFPRIVLLLLILLINTCKKEVEVESVFPSVKTKPVIVSESDYASCGGIIGTNGNVEILQRGVVWGFIQNHRLITIGYTNDGIGAGEFNSSLINLQYNTLYYVNAYAITSSKTIYGNIQEFGLWRGPIAKTLGASMVKGTSAILNGYVIPYYPSTNASIQFGVDTNYFLTKPINDYPLSGNNKYEISFKMEDLEPNHQYHYRVIAGNAMGTTYGKDTSFTTKDVFEDIDHNSYPIVVIGSQTWMMENLKTTHYTNGDLIPNTSGSSSSTTFGSYWEYGNNILYVQDYGRLYNYYATIDGRNICPIGWHVPSLTELNILQLFLGTSTGGNKMKESGTTHWSYPNACATNESDFTALPGGYRTSNGNYANMGTHGYWLTVTANSSTNVNCLSVNSSYPTINILSLDKTSGFSVRCIKGTIPLAITGEAENVTGNSAVLHGIINPNDEPATVSFEYGLTKTYDEQIILNNDFSSNSSVNVEGEISGLLNGKIYHYRIKAESKYGTVYGNDATFKTSTLPSVFTLSCDYVSPSSVKVRGRAIANNSLTTIYFLFGESSEYGQTLTPDNNIINGYSPVILEYEITGLSPGIVYHFNTKAINDNGEVTGDDWAFTTEMLQDYDGNRYGIVKIRNRYWMLENLSTTHFGNGDPIPEIQDLSSFTNSTTEAYCNYNNSSELGIEYGKLYNASVATDPRNVCPAGWYVPYEYDWRTLTNYYEEGELKETGTKHWLTTSENVNNISGLTALPGGYRYTSDFKELGIAGYWWCSDSYSPFVNEELYAMLDNISTNYTVKSGNINHGFSIRCIEGAMPIAKTGSATNITNTSATVSGIVNGNTLPTSVSFGYGPTDYYTFNLPANPEVVTGSNAVNVTLTITNLTPGTSYFYNVKASNASATVYGGGHTFTTLK